MPSSGPQYTRVDAAAVVESAVPAATALPMIEVVAPATLSEGFTFEAQVGDDVEDRILVTVPKGGVSQGQKFVVPPSTKTKESNASSNIPIGQWKDGLCNCCTDGPCHPMCCLACWCSPIALAQLMTRTHLNWYGSPGSVSEVSSTFQRLSITFMLFLFVDFGLSTAMSYCDPNRMATGDDNDDRMVNPTANHDTNIPFPLEIVVVMSIRWTLWFAFFICMLLLLIRTRAQVRRKYAIAERSCRGCEDCCCAVWCATCSICQMARHTGSYDVNAAQCCTTTGLPPGVEVV